MQSRAAIPILSILGLMLLAVSTAAGGDAMFRASRLALAGGSLSGGGTGGVALISADGGSAGVPADDLLATLPSDSLAVMISVCTSRGCDYGNATLPQGSIFPGPLAFLMDPLLSMAKVNVGVPSSVFTGGTLTASLTITGTGDQTPTVSPGVIPASPAELSLNAGMSRKGVPSGTISSSTLGSRSFAPTATGLLVEGASGLISVP